MYNPSENITVDEQQYPFKGRCQFRQYMPKKPAKYGIKFWVACCSKSSYAWNMQICTGKPSSGTRKKNQGMRVVLDMVKGLKGHNVTCDNFFTSYSLGVELKKEFDFEKHPAWNVGRLHKRRLFLEELGKALVQPEMMRRKTLPRTAAAKSAVERLRKDAEKSSTSLIRIQVVKKELDVNCTFKVTTRQAYVVKNAKNTFVKIIHNHIVIYVQKKFNRSMTAKQTVQHLWVDLTQRTKGVYNCGL
ncbi:PiggyBac transposable element-derived protein 4 [Trichinella sp. T8]|nr:PiggyBac transposable element-derived protein 4 [Trichinella sp. T8]